ncbi:MAG: bifunctional phosphopantothenoylcysteine decarboxylase/phosphopantothenate--cysteine ligase CoaBC, partial [Alphaproteobacteria bacterium]|nr:bifunctional phosphopantothenoylcysteine decarboxylase/phosphopantothenate--cysteine ligase CoaBC [Alphaproteobacteria bacterium]
MTEGATHFVTPLSVAALAEHKVYQDLFSLTDESEMGHIRLSRESDLIVVAPATADLMARMAAGMADDLAATVLLATDKPVLLAPTMNVMMWNHAATQANVTLLRARGIFTVGPGSGDLACGEVGSGRMAEPHEIINAIEYVLSPRPLEGQSALVTSGPTYEPIDPVRFIGNRSSGKQGHAIAAALQRAGARTTLISGPTREPDPAGVALVRIETAAEMLAAVDRLLPVDIAVCAAAVADWRVATPANAKMKKDAKGPPALTMVENPDILTHIGTAGARRPRLVVGFAAETENLIANARAKLKKKHCDWVLANDVSPATGTFGGDANTVHLVTADAVEDWPTLTKTEVAARLAARVGQHLGRA